MFLFNEFGTYTKEQVEHILDCPLVLPAWMTIHHSFADVNAVFAFKSAFIATHDGVIVGIETGQNRYGRIEYNIFEKYLLRNKCGWWVNGGDVWELDEQGKRLGVVMSLERVYDNRDFVRSIRHIFCGKENHLFSNVFYRRINIDSLLAEL